MIHLTEKNLVKAFGNVVVRYGDRKVYANEIIVNTETGQGQATGRVVMTAEDGTKLRAQKARFNIKSQVGRLYSVRGKIGKEYYVTGEEIQKVGENHYRGKDTSLTTCTGEIPDWIIETENADLKIEDRALFSGGVFRVKNVPILYIPLGYIPLSTKRKSGFLTPKVGVSNLDGFTLGNQYFWAINQWSDATLGVDIMTKRGVRGLLEVRYTPSKTTKGQFNGVILDDDLTGKTFWKVDGTHQQENLPFGFNMNAKLDQTSKSNFNKTFRNQTENRTRRSSDSFLSLFRSWKNHSFDLLTRFRESEEDGRDDTFGILPTATFKTQSLQLGDSNFYFNQETSYSHFLIDVNSDPSQDDLEGIQRFDFHPQLSYTWNIAPWMQFTTDVGLRGTYYSKEVQFNETTKTKTIGGSFTRELFDITAALEGPKFNRIFLPKDGAGAAFKHVFEPRLEYTYIPEMDENDRSRIRVIDAIDSINDTSRLTLFLTQRLLRKDTDKNGRSETRQVARFEVSQSFDFLEATRFETSSNRRRPFSNLRLDLDSQLTDYFMLNFDTTLNVHNAAIETFNMDVGIKPTDWLMLILEKRHIHNQSASLLGTVEFDLPKGWNMKYSARYDEFHEEFLEHNGRITFDNHCKCWGFALDIINRKNINGDVRTTETKFLFSIQLRGLGGLDSARGEQFLHRTF
jgi:LPS-assembly protein